ncbi:site-specific integrase [Oxalobacteraceae sp. CFBP 8755]|nr:site-specific integrase [Oxalobacteraceae sp. CFBP 8755]MBD8726235.1 site-specific integrase [Oxalobacteraceae sp. CFBP 13708]
MVALKWHELDGFTVCVAFESKGSAIFTELTDYSIYLSCEKALAETTVINELRYVAGFLAELKRGRRLIANVDDDFIRKWRDAEFVRVRENPIARNDSHTMKRTVNAKLRRIYDFYWWYQRRKSSLRNIIGPTGQIISSGSIDSMLSPRNAHSKARRGGSSHIYPLCFRNVGAGSKHRVATIPTISKIDEIRKILSAKELGFMEQRNLLMLSIAEETGLRRAAINSLRVSQFSEELLLEMDEGGLVVVPDVQKFSYQSSVRFSPGLCLLILNFAKQCLMPFCRQRGWSPSYGNGRLFISERNGKPLEASSLTRIFSRAFRRAGFQKGSAIHLVRHHFTNVEIVKETERRLKAGLDTSLPTICEAVSFKLNHLDPMSIRAYVSAVISDLAAEMEKNVRAEAKFEAK